MSTNTKEQQVFRQESRDKLAEALAQYEAALLFAYPEGARGAAFDCWNKARQALAAHEAAAQARALAPAQHIKRPYSLSELREKIASHEYGAELLLQHAMLLLDQTPAEPAGEAVPAMVRCPRCWELVTAPAAPAAEPLTDEQIMMLGQRAMGKCFGTDAQHVYIAREVERAHGIVASGGEVQK